MALNIPNVFIARPSKVYQIWDFCFGNKTIWQPCFRHEKFYVCIYICTTRHRTSQVFGKNRCSVLVSTCGRKIKHNCFYWLWLRKSLETQQMAGSQQGDPMSSWKNGPKCSPTHFFVKISAYT
jgi:hypothetical protein